MKTLKKTLCLMLALVLAVGTLAVSAGATDFKDDADIEYDEAVNVLTGIGVIDGVDGNKFNPTGTLTREQAAKIATYLIIGKEKAEKLSGSDAFSDVPADRWSAGYIAYCASKGILAGVGDGKFNPTGKLTGYAWAKILLCALGYDAKAEGLEGEYWQTNTQELANEIGLADGVDGFDYAAEISREEACELAFTALFCDTVKYATTGSSITVSGSDIDVTISSGASEADPTGHELYEAAYGDLVVTPDETDEFNRFGTLYEFDGEEIYFAADGAVKTYEGAVASKTIYSDLKLKATATADVYEDGVDNGTFSIEKTGTSKIGANGSTVEVYKDGTDIYVVVINTYVDTVNKVNKATDSTKANVELKDSGLTYETENFAKGDVVIYTKADGEVMTMAVAESVEDVTVSKITGTTSFVADGETYKFSKNYVDAGLTVKGEYNLYLDEQGYVIFAEEYSVDVETTIALVLDTDTVTASRDLFDSDDTVYGAKVLYTDGTAETIYIDKDSYDASLDGKIVEIAETSTEGIYKMEAVTSATASVEITTGKVAEKGGAFTADAKTKYVIVSGTEKKPVYTAYTSYKNVESVKGTAIWTENTKGYAEYVFIGNLEDISEKSVTFIALDTKSDLVKDTDNTTGYYTYDAIVDGEITTLKVNADVTVYEFAEVETNAKGFVTAATVKAAPYAVKFEGYDVDYVNEVLQFIVTGGTTANDEDKFAIADDVAVFFIDAAGIEAGEFDDVDGLEDVTVYVFTNTKGFVTGLYIFE